MSNNLNSARYPLAIEQPTNSLVDEFLSTVDQLDW
jgi:hypothetical protein